MNDDLAKIQTDIAGRSLSISEDLNTLSMISRRWMIAGGALILGLVILVGFFAWLLMQSAKPEAISDYRSFMQDDRRYLVFPGERDQELPDEQRRRGVLRDVAERGVSGHERETDSVRARFAATVRGIGSRLRERLEQFGGRVEKLRELGSNMKVTFDQLARRQSALEQRQKTLIEALDVQTKLTEAWKEQSESLVRQVNALLTEHKK